MNTTLPADSLLSRYAVAADGSALPHYTDCFVADVAAVVGLPDFVEAFYTTPLFRAERLVLRLFGFASTDSDVVALAAGQTERFAAWTLEARRADELLMCDARGATRSWFRVAAGDDSTRLYFGSAVIARRSGAPPMTYRMLLGLHRLYSRLLLSAAVRRLAARRD